VNLPVEIPRSAEQGCAHSASEVASPGESPLPKKTNSGSNTRSRSRCRLFRVMVLDARIRCSRCAPKRLIASHSTLRSGSPWGNHRMIRDRVAPVSETVPLFHLTDRSFFRSMSIVTHYDPSRSFALITTIRSRGTATPECCESQRSRFGFRATIFLSSTARSSRSLRPSPDGLVHSRMSFRT